MALLTVNAGTGRTTISAAVEASREAFEQLASLQQKLASAAPAVSSSVGLRP